MIPQSRHASEAALHCLQLGNGKEDLSVDYSTDWLKWTLANTGLELNKSTVFAPTDKAFKALVANLGLDSVEGLLGTGEGSAVTKAAFEVLGYHSECSWLALKGNCVALPHPLTCLCLSFTMQLCLGLL
jgi:hypothetical protein